MPPPRTLLVACGALVTLVMGCTAAPAGTSRYVALPAPDLGAYRSFQIERCLAACPGARPGEQLTACFPASTKARTRIMSEHVADTHLVCAYAPAGGAP